jgi:hypothetical protein
VCQKAYLSYCTYRPFHHPLVMVCGVGSMYSTALCTGGTAKQKTGPRFVSLEPFMTSRTTCDLYNLTISQSLRILIVDKKLSVCLSDMIWSILGHIILPVSCIYVWCSHACFLLYLCRSCSGIQSVSHTACMYVIK